MGCIGQSNRFFHRYKISRLGHTVWMSFHPLTIQCTSDIHLQVFSLFRTYSKNIMKTWPFKYIENFTTKKGKFSDKTKSDIFHISAQNIDCGYLLEPP